jgi:GxxExxY protein
MPIQDPLTQQIIGLCYRIANTLGHGFVEKVYENALAFELRRAKIPFVQQQPIDVFYEGQRVGRYKADLVVEGKVIVEVKAIQALSEVDVTQGLNYLRATGLPTCLLVNFGKAKIEVRRLGMSPGKGTGTLELEVKDIE